MRILYIDIDSLRPDHLGCYGYHRNTSPNIDRIARQGVRFDNCYASDAPCLPSRTALWSGRTGFHSGVINHGGTAANPISEGAARGFIDVYGKTGWIPTLRRAGIYPVSISPFGERHSAWWWHAGFREIYNTGKGGTETADEITPVALDWLQRRAKTDNWFLHVNLWDPHTPYRTPRSFGNPFENDPLPDWLTEQVRERCWNGFGPHSAQEPHGYLLDDPAVEQLLQVSPRMPRQIDSMESLRRWIDGYDVGIRYADEHIGRLLNALADVGVLDDIGIMISADHGESQGELNVWGDHQTADVTTCRVPLIVDWKGMPMARADRALHHQFDWAATMIELLGGQVPANWDGRAFTSAFRAGEERGRDYLVVGQGAWACQRGVRWDHRGEAYLCLRTYHDGHKLLEPAMLFDLTRDPHEGSDISSSHPDLVDHAMALLADWEREQMLASTTNVDPMLTVLREGGPFHTRGHLPSYLKRLRATGRVQHADRLARLHPDEIG